jgi:hypothetical protein
MAARKSAVAALVTWQAIARGRAWHRARALMDAGPHARLNAGGTRLAASLKALGMGASDLAGLPAATALLAIVTFPGTLMIARLERTLAAPHAGLVRPTDSSVISSLDTTGAASSGADVSTPKHALATHWAVERCRRRICTAIHHNIMFTARDSLGHLDPAENSL